MAYIKITLSKFEYNGHNLEYKLQSDLNLTEYVIRKDLEFSYKYALIKDNNIIASVGLFNDVKFQNESLKLVGFHKWKLLNENIVEISDDDFIILNGQEIGVISNYGLLEWFFDVIKNFKTNKLEQSFKIKFNEDILDKDFAIFFLLIKFNDFVSNT